MRLFLTAVFLVSFGSAWALETRQSASELDAKIRKREFPGGVDEADLKVQENVATPLLRYDKKSVQKQVFENIQKEEPKDSQVK